MIADVELLYREHLSEHDRALLAASSDLPLSASLSSVELEATLLSPRSAGGLAGHTPFLTFAVAVHRTASTLEHASYVQEPAFSRQRIPVFDVAPLREFLADPMRRFFLAELLASYTHVSSGVTWERTRRGWRKRRFSELDPVRLCEMLEAARDLERPGIYRRLGDLSLFLTGVFPDRHGAHRLGDVATARMTRILRLKAVEDEIDDLQFFEEVGARCYRSALAIVRANAVPVTAEFAVAGEMATRFRQARRVLNVITDRYLFPLREGLFGQA